jgi:hypothetical protein
MIVAEVGRERRVWGLRVSVVAVERNKVNVKGNGQECLFHTYKSKINVKSDGEGVRGSHPSTG